ncbi:MAG: tyrosine-type recombinase/integrase [Xanthobacteraceae bacterium]
MKGHIRERSLGRWAIVLEMRDPETGRRKRKWHSFSGTKRQAQSECARLICEVNGGTYVEPTKITLVQFLDRWLDDVRTRVTPKTHERYAQICHKNIAPFLGAVLLVKLRPEQISDAYAKALASGRRRGEGGLSPRTVRQMHAILKSALAQAVKWDILVRNPAAAVRGPKVGRSAMQTYDLEQTAELIKAARGRRVFIPMLLAVLGGLRRGEIAALRWRHVDLAATQLAVVQSAEQTLAGVRYKEPKSGRGRTIALSDTLVTELRAHRVRQAEELLRFGKRLSDDDFVITQPEGSPLRPHSLGQEWVRFLAGHGALPRIRFHDLRHAHATHLLASGVHPKVASERLGHSKVGITLDLYSHVLPNMQADAAAMVDGALKAVLNKREIKG